LHKKTFYPGKGAKLITEGKNDQMAYVIVEGTLKIVCKKSQHKFTMLEYDNDPTKAMRDEE
jgi:hypothetical protein